MHWAASYGNLEHMKLLIKQDSNSGIPDSDGKTPLHWAASSHDGMYSTRTYQIVSVCKIGLRPYCIFKT